MGVKEGDKVEKFDDSTDSTVGMEDGATSGHGPFFPFGLLFWGAFGDLKDLELDLLVLGLFDGLEDSCWDSKLVGVKDEENKLDGSTEDLGFFGAFLFGFFGALLLGFFGALLFPLFSIHGVLLPVHEVHSRHFLGGGWGLMALGPWMGWIWLALSAAAWVGFLEKLVVVLKLTPTPKGSIILSNVIFPSRYCS